MDKTLLFERCDYFCCYLEKLATKLKPRESYCRVISTTDRTTGELVTSLLFYKKNGKWGNKRIDFRIDVNDISNIEFYYRVFYNHLGKKPFLPLVPWYPQVDIKFMINLKERADYCGVVCYNWHNNLAYKYHCRGVNHQESFYPHYDWIGVEDEPYFELGGDIYKTMEYMEKSGHAPSMDIIDTGPMYAVTSHYFDAFYIPFNPPIKLT